MYATGSEISDLLHQLVIGYYHLFEGLQISFWIACEPFLSLLRCFKSLSQWGPLDSFIIPYGIIRFTQIWQPIYGPIATYKWFDLEMNTCQMIVSYTKMNMGHIILCMKHSLCMNMEFCFLVIFNFEPC